jgi:2,3-bisphosphoglycerate-dependent phosphoglycerate mutase
LANPAGSMIFLVRHAHSDYIPDDMRPLSPSGRLAAERVADTLEGRDITRIISSPYTRAVQTVEPLARRLGIQVECDPDLRERRLTDGQIAGDFRDYQSATWKDFDLAYPGGETSNEARTRISRAIRRIAEANTGRHVAIASHGNALALFLQTLDGTVDFEFWMQMSMPDVYAIETSAAGPWSVKRLWQAV